MLLAIFNAKKLSKNLARKNFFVPLHCQTKTITTQTITTMETKEVKTLGQLAEFINECEDWSLEVSGIIEANRWKDITGEERGVCLCEESNEKVVLNDEGEAVIERI